MDTRCISDSCEHVSDHGPRRMPSEGEGACLAEFKGRSHLPLRGKLGWMTPRIWCENDTRYETCLPGLRVPSWSPIFLPLTIWFLRGTRHDDGIFGSRCDGSPAVKLTRTAPLQFNSIFSKPRFLPDRAHAPLAFRAAVKRHIQSTIPFLHRSV